MPELQFNQDDLIKLANAFEIEQKVSPDTQAEESYFKIKETATPEQIQEAVHILGILTRIEPIQFDTESHQYYRSADLEAIATTDALANAVKAISIKQSTDNYVMPDIDETIVRQAFETDGKILRIKPNASQNDILAAIRELEPLEANLRAIEENEQIIGYSVSPLTLVSGELDTRRFNYIINEIVGQQAPAPITENLNETSNDTLTDNNPTLSTVSENLTAEVSSANTHSDVTDTADEISPLYDTALTHYLFSESGKREVYADAVRLNEIFVPLAGVLILKETATDRLQEGLDLLNKYMKVQQEPDNLFGQNVWVPATENDWGVAQTLIYPAMDAAISTRQTVVQVMETEEKTDLSTPAETKRKTQERFWNLHNGRNMSARYTSDANEILYDELKYAVLEDLGFPAVNPDTMTDEELHQYVIETYNVLTKSEKESFQTSFLEKTFSVVDILPPKALVQLHQELNNQKNPVFDASEQLMAIEAAMDKQIDDYVNGQTVVNQDNIMDVYSGFSSSIDLRLNQNSNAQKAKTLLENEIRLYDTIHGLNGLSDTDEARLSHRLDEVKNLIDSVFETPDYIHHLHFTDRHGQTVKQIGSDCEIENLKTIVKDKLLTDITFDFEPLDRSQIKLKSDNLFDTAVVSLIANTLHMRGQNPDEAGQVFQNLKQGQSFDIPQLTLAGASAAYINEQSGLINRVAQKVGKSSSSVHKMSDSIKTIDTMADNRFKEEYPKTNLAKACFKKFFYGSITGAMASGIGLAATAMSLPAAPVVAGAMAIYTMGAMWWQRKKEINHAKQHNQPVPSFASFLKRNTVRTLLTTTSLGSTALGMPVVGLSLGAIGAIKNIGHLYAKNRKEGRGFFASLFRAVPEAMATVAGAVLTGTAVHAYGAEMGAPMPVNEAVGQNPTDTTSISNNLTDTIPPVLNENTMTNTPVMPMTSDTTTGVDTVSDTTATDTGDTGSADTAGETGTDNPSDTTGVNALPEENVILSDINDETFASAEELSEPVELSNNDTQVTQPATTETQVTTPTQPATVEPQVTQPESLIQPTEDSTATDTASTEIKNPDVHIEETPVSDIKAEQPHPQSGEHETEGTNDDAETSVMSVKIKDVQEVLDRADVPDDIGEDMPSDDNTQSDENEPQVIRTIHHDYSDEAHQLAQARLAGEGLYDKTGMRPISPDYTTDELNQALAQITKLEATHPEFTGSNGVSNADILMHKLNQVDRLISEDTTLKIDGHRIDAEQALGVKTQTGWYSTHDLRADLLAGKPINTTIAAEVLNKVETAVDEYGRFILDVHGLNERRFVSFDLNGTPGFETHTVETVITPEPVAETTVTPEPVVEPTTESVATSETTVTTEPVVEPTTEPVATPETTVTPEPVATPETTVTPEPVTETVIAPQPLAEPTSIMENTLNSDTIPTQTPESITTPDMASEQTVGQKMAQIMEIPSEINETIQDIVSTVKNNPMVQDGVKAISPVLDNPTVQHGINTVRDIFQGDNPPPIIVPFENKNVIQPQSQRQDGIGAAPIPAETVLADTNEPVQKNKGRLLRHPASGNISRPPKMGLGDTITQNTGSNQGIEQSPEQGQAEQKPNGHFFRKLFVRGKDPK